MKKILLAGVALLCFSAQPVYANEGDLVSFAIGYYDVFDDEGALDLRLEYRPNSIVFIENLKPWAGLEVTSDTSIWAGAGLLYDIHLAEEWYLTPSAGVGFYAQGSSDTDLDNAFQFRTQLELAYEFEDTGRMGLSISHISNAGLGDKNPGTEVIGLYWHLPLDSIF